MGIYNPNAEMPKNCAVCKEDCSHRNITAHKRHKRCPLVEIEIPHGRLIDADELEEDDAWSDYEDGFTAYSRLQISTQPTVIEAEVE